MSQQPINHSNDLKKLRDDGFDIIIQSNYLVIRNVPYVNSNREIMYGTLVSDLKLAGNITTKPDTHVIHFDGEYPCNKDGSEIKEIKHQSSPKNLGNGLTVHHSFSSKPHGGYSDYYDKVRTYVAIISNPAQSINPNVTARTFPVIEADESESVLNYIDTSSSRANINAVSKKLELDKISIVGLGGTGAYILDLVAKTPVKRIHIFDGDTFSQHNAFRAPGAPSLAKLRKQLPKVTYYKNIYSKMHKGIIAHDVFIDASNVQLLQDMAFVFLCLDKGEVKRIIVQKLEEHGVPFIDVGMGVELVDETLIGILRVTTSTKKKRDHVYNHHRISFSDGDENNEYSKNIQIADLNALNAALAVIKWKKLLGFYGDLENEFHSLYTIDGNTLTNEDHL